MQNPKYSNHFRFSSDHLYFYSKSNTINGLLYNELTLNNNHSVFHKSPWTYVTYNEIFKTACWKIHISATICNYKKVLQIVSLYCDDNTLNHKFNSNLNSFILMNSKEVSRVSSGKFITIYITETDDLEYHLERLSKKLAHFEGPYILTDRKYSNNIYYRFGEYYPINLLNEYGTFENFIIEDNTHLIHEERKPYYQEYEWTINPIKNLDDTSEVDSTLLNFYDVEEALYFSGGGGVYLGTKKGDTKKVVIKEARQFSGLDYNLVYFQERLDIEFQALNSLSSVGIAPTPIDLIQDNGNTYLVEEYIRGISLKKYILKNNPMMRPKNFQKNAHIYFKNIIKIISQIKKIITEVHKRGRIIGDLSFNNFIINEDSLDVKIIDLETCIAIKDTEANHKIMITPGFNNTSMNLFENDWGKFETLVISTIFPLNNILHYHRNKLPEIIQLLLSFKNDYPDIPTILQFIGKYDKSINNSAPKTSLLNITDTLYKSIKNQYSLDGNILFPADPHVYNTNKFSISHGLFGILNSINIVSNNSKEFIKNILNDETFYTLFKSTNLPQGLFIGYSGICWVLINLGYQKIGSQLFDRKVLNSINTDNGIFYGNAGNLLTSLKIYMATKDKKYLNYANTLASHLSSLKLNNDSLTGYGEGLSGIVLSLIYYYQISQEKDVLFQAINIFDFELKNMTDTDDYLGIKRNFEKSDRMVHSPYIYDGIAGVGTVAIRLYLSTKNKKYLNVIKKIVNSCDYNITLFSGYMRGMSGIISFLTDVIKYHPDTQLQNKCHIIINNFIKSMNLHILNTDVGVFFLGEQLYKASCDYSTGSAGIMLQIFYYNNYTNMNNPNFFLDELLDK